jgi:hypothetical protein
MKKKLNKPLQPLFAYSMGLMLLRTHSPRQVMPNCGNKPANSLSAMLIGAVFLLLAAPQLWAQTTVSSTAAGSYSWTAPCGVTSATIKVWGGGGGGGVGGSNNGEAAGGGGGGGYSTITVAVVPGTTYTGTVGTGGSGGTSTVGAASNGSTGGTSTMFGISATGGNGGLGFANGATGGTGGTGSGGTQNFSGGNGANAVNGTNPCGNNTGRAGGGGEGACTTGNGNNAINNTGGTGCDGGDGGNGACSNQSGGLAGAAPGGGGAGTVKNFLGPAGGIGQISITFSCPLTLANAGSDQTLAACTTTASISGNSFTCATSQQWSVVSGTGTITAPTNPSTTVTGIPIGGTVTLRWSINTGAAPTGCGTYTDDVVITSPCPANTLNAGSDQTLAVCATTATLAANTLACGSGSWSVVSGSGTVTTPTSATSGVTGLVPGVATTLRWTWTFPSPATCGPYTDDVVITSPAPPAPTGSPIIVNSQCFAPCTVAGGSIAIGSLACSGGSLEYSTNGGITWSSSLPSYNQTTALSFIARCSCSGSGGTVSSTYTTTPGVCLNCPPSCNASNGTITSP